MVGGSKPANMSRWGNCYANFLLLIQDFRGHWRDAKMVGSLRCWCGLKGLKHIFLRVIERWVYYSWTCGLRWDWKRYYGQYFTHRYVWQRWCFGRNSIDIWRYVWDDCSLMEYFKGSILQQLSRGRRGSISSFYWIAAWTCNARCGHFHILREGEYKTSYF